MMIAQEQLDDLRLETVYFVDGGDYWRRGTVGWSLEGNTPHMVLIGYMKLDPLIHIDVDLIRS